MKIEQPIIKYKTDDIIKVIENIIKREFNGDMKIFFPKNKKWFIDNMNLIKKMAKDKNIEKTLIYYKKGGYIMINSILHNNSFPLIYLHKDFDNANLFRKTIIGTEPTYLFPKDISLIKEYEKNRYLNYIDTLDLILNFNTDFLLDDCMLFKGYTAFIKKFHSKKINMKILSEIDANILPYGSEYLLQEYNNFIFNNKKVTLKAYNSFSLDPLIALKFIEDSGYLLVLKVNKNDKVPGIFLSNIFLYKNIKYNNFLNKNKDEIELLLPRNLKIKIVKKKEIKLSKLLFDRSINQIYTNENRNNRNKYNKIKIIYAETMPYQYEQQFMPDNDGFEYFCV